MRKVFLLAVLALSLLWTAAAQAAEVTDVKWGVDKNNVLRFVVDVTDTAGYAVQLEDKSLKLTVNAESGSQVAKIYKVKSPLADSMQVVSVGDNTEVHVPLKRQLTAKDYKAFVLKKDPQTGRPFRVVLDLTAARTAAPAGAAAAGSAVGKTVVGNKPVVSSTPTKGGVKAESKPAADKKTVKSSSQDEDEDKDRDRDKDKDKDKDKKKNKNKDKDREDTKVIKGNGRYRTSGGLKGKVITLDAGHGGSDPGAIGAKGTREKVITLAITKRVKELLEKEGAKVQMTRTRDTDVFGPNASDRDELQARVNVAEKYNSDVFLSLHINSSVNKKIGGFSTYYYPKTGHDLRLATALQKQLADNFGVDNLGVRQANFYVTKRCSMPAALLELCFISNPKEETLMNGNWFQKKTARMIVEGLEKYFK